MEMDEQEFRQQCEQLSDQLYDVIKKQPLSADRVMVALASLAAIAGHVLSHSSDKDLAQLIRGFINHMMMNLGGTSYTLEVEERSQTPPVIN